jgi:hypothetical protein
MFETGLILAGSSRPAKHRRLARSGNLLELRMLWISWQTRMPLTLRFLAPSQQGHDHHQRSFKEAWTDVQSNDLPTHHIGASSGGTCQN